MPTSCKPPPYLLGRLFHPKEGFAILSGKVVKVSGPLVVATGLADANMADVVRVGQQRLIGEILTMTGDSAAIQVYEETSGLGPGAEVETTGFPLSVELRSEERRVGKEC